jgi:hypothetical protein
MMRENDKNNNRKGREEKPEKRHLLQEGDCGARGREIF